MRIVAIELQDAGGAALPVARAGQDVALHLHFENQAPDELSNINVYLLVTNPLGAPIFAHSNQYTGERFGSVPRQGAMILRLPRLPLPEGIYRLEYLIRSECKGGTLFDRMANAFEMRVIGGDFFGQGALPPARQGVCLVDGEWRLQSRTAGLPCPAGVHTD